MVNCTAAEFSAPNLAILHSEYKIRARTTGQTEPRRCVKVEVDVLGSWSLTVRTVSVDLEQHVKKKKKWSNQF